MGRLKDTTIYGNASVSRILHTDSLKFSTTPSTAGDTPQVYWDNEHKTLAVVTGEGPILQVGQEEYIRIYNGTGVTLTSGNCVRIVGVDTHHPDVTLSRADTREGSIFHAMVTATIAPAAYGMATEIGQVHDIDTSAWAPGTYLYLSPTVAGSYSDYRPLAPSYTTVVGITMEQSTLGTIYVNPNLDLGALASFFQEINITSKDPTGWVNNEQVTASYDSTARTITFTGDLRYAWRGQIVDLGSTWTSSAHPATLDVPHFLYSTDGENFNWYPSVWDFHDLIAAYVYYGTNDKLCIREPHGVMNWESHREFHNTVGTWKLSGGDFSGYTLSSILAADRRPQISQTLIVDEDIVSTCSALTTPTFCQATLSGSTPSLLFNTAGTDIVPVSGSRPYWNQNVGGTWQQTLMDNNTYMSIWVFAVPASSDPTSQKYRYIFLQGQTNGGLSSEQTKGVSDLDLTAFPGFATEFICIGKIIIEYTAGNWNLVSVEKVETTRASSTGGVGLTSVVSDYTLNGNGTAASPLYINQSMSILTQDSPTLDYLAAPNQRVTLTTNSTISYVNFPTLSAGGVSYIIDFTGTPGTYAIVWDNGVTLANAAPDHTSATTSMKVYVESVFNEIWVHLVDLT